MSARTTGSARARAPFPAAITAVACAVLLALAPRAALAQQPQNPPQHAGFPLTIAGGGPSFYSQPAVADLGLDGGRKSIVFGTQAGNLYVVLATGQIAPGFPKHVPAPINSSPAVADLDGDRAPDVVVGFGSSFDVQHHGGIRAFGRNGTLLWKRSTRDFDGDGWRDAVFSTPAIGDVDGDGKPEVAYASWDGRVYLVRGADGTNVPQWPRFVRDTVWSSPALHDLDGDGKLEVIVGVDAHLEGIPTNTPDGGCLHAFRYDGTELNGFPVCVDQVMVSSSSVGDIDGDGLPDIVIGTGTYWPNRTHAVYAFARDGSPLLGWPVAVDGQVSTSPALADLDGDGALDVVVTSDDTGPSHEFHVDAFDGDGERLFPSVVPKSFSGAMLGAGEPVIADVRGDAAREILFPTNTEVCVVSSTGDQLTDDGSHDGSFSMYTATGLADAVVDDLEGDGVPEVIAVSAAPFPSATDTVVHVWNPLSRTAAAPPWGAFRAGPERRGVAPATAVGNGARYGALDLYVHQLFLDFLRREPGPGEMQPWIDAIESQSTTRAGAGLAFLETEQYQQARETIARYTLAFFGKPMSWKFLKRWTNKLLAAGCTGLDCDEATRRQIAASFAAKAPFLARFPATLTTRQYVQALYEKILMRSPSADDLDVWSQAIDEGGMPRSEAARMITESTEYVVDRSRWPVFVVLAWAGFLHAKPPAAELADWVAALALDYPRVSLVQELITSDAYLARFAP
ncbi:MAG TPA: FG-GAP-like repeat-containing protein [Candidatus Binatia bacterium]|nr:FG-GAP-like repeat-containing protein [Candidatus Binatia bacterium]